MEIRTATLKDLDAVSAVESACFPVAEAATPAEFEERLRYYGSHFWLMLDHDKLIGFVDGMVTDGEVMVNQASLTGESLPVAKRPGGL